MTIGELSKRTGIPSSTVRYWEQVRVLPKPMRVGDQRRYTAKSAIFPPGAARSRLARLGLSVNAKSVWSLG